MKRISKIRIPKGDYCHQQEKWCVFAGCDKDGEPICCLFNEENFDIEAQDCVKIPVCKEQFYYGAVFELKKS